MERLLAPAANALPAAQYATALQHQQNLIASATPPTRTPVTTFTPSYSSTRTPTASPTSTRTPTANSTATPTPTPLVTATATP